MKKAEPRICHITSGHPHDDVRISKECLSVHQAGYFVTLIAPGERNQANQPFPGVSVSRPRSRWERFLLTPILLFWAALKARPTLIHFHDPELIPLGVLFKLAGVKVVYDIHENVPKQLSVKEWIPCAIRSLFARMFSLFECFFAFFFAGRICVLPSIAERFSKKNTRIVRNLPRKNDFACIAHEPTRENNIIFVGGLSRGRGLFEIVEAIEIVNRSVQARLQLVGKFWEPDLMEAVKTKQGWDYCQFVPWLDRNALREVFSHASVGIITFHPEPNNLESIPNKLFEYVGAGLPVVASDFPYWRDLLNNLPSCIFVDPLSPVKIACAIEKILQNSHEYFQAAEKSKREISERFNWENEEKELLSLYRELLPLGESR